MSLRAGSPVIGVPSQVGEQEDQLVPLLRLGVPGDQDRRGHPADGRDQVGLHPPEGAPLVVEARREHRLDGLRLLLVLVPVGPPELDDGGLGPGQDRVAELGEGGGPVGDRVQVVGDGGPPAERGRGRGEQVRGDEEGLGAVEIDVSQVGRVGAEYDPDVPVGERGRVVGPPGPEPGIRVLARLGAALLAAGTGARLGSRAVDGDGLPPGRMIPGE
jgi:hypothetical protein